MTYQEIVNRIQDVVNQHYMLADFGYGDLSDLKTRFENTSGDSAVEADYPYLFLNPATHTRTGAAVTYNFNMIVMDMARGEVSDIPYNNILAIQSQCQQYIDDVIAQLWNGYVDQPQVLWDGLSYNTFNERFQDDVAGMTVNLQIMVPQAINNCITPISRYRNLIEVTDLTERTLGPDFGDDTVFVYAVDVYNPDGDWQVNRYIVPEAGIYRVEMTQEITLNAPVGSETIPNQPVVRELTDGPDRNIAATTATGWPTQFVDTNTVYTFKATWDITIDSVNPAGYTWEFISLVDVPGQEESTIQQLPGGRVKIYRLQ